MNFWTFVKSALIMALIFPLSARAIEISDDPIIIPGEGKHPCGVGWGDMNSDGWLDLVVSADNTYILENHQQDVNILLLMDYRYGANFCVQDAEPNIYEQFSDREWNMTIASIYESIAPCIYGIGVGCTVLTADTLLSQIDDITQYDAITILPNALASPNICASQHALDLIKDAANAGVIVSGWCRGVRAMALADVLDGKDVVGNADYQAEYEAAGANFMGNDHPPIIDENIVTIVRSRYYRTEGVQAIADAIAQARLLCQAKVEEYALDDVLSGNGDGIFDNGESVNLNFTVRNFGNIPLTGVTASLSMDDTTITITDGNAYLGDIAIKATADNSSDPIIFTVPVDYVPRWDTLYIELSYNLTEVDTFAFSTALGTPKILLVDDDAGTGIVDYYSDALESLKIPGRTWEASKGTRPTAAEMNAYDVIIWMAGNYQSSTLDATEISEIQTYLDNGGNLFMTGQGIAAGLLFDGQTDFLGNYLKASYVGTIMIPSVEISATSQAFATRDSIYISGGDGAGNQSNPDYVQPVNGGVGEMNFPAYTDYCAISYSGDYKLIFLTFGFEAIRSDNDNYSSRPDILYDVLSFLGYQQPTGIPALSDLTVTPGDTTHMTNHTPELAWIYADPQGHPQAYYQIQASDDEDWSSAELWDSGPVTGSATSTAYAGDPPDDGDDCYIRIRAHNGYFWSNWSFSYFHMNSIPIPTALTPSNLDEYIPNPPLLYFPAKSDNEGDPVTYSIQLYEDEFLTSLIEEITDLDGGESDTIYWQTTTQNPNYAYYYWRARCEDGLETGQWSDLAVYTQVRAFLCGDANADERVNVGDAVYLVNLIFHDGPLPIPSEAGDVNCDESVNIGDAVYLVNFIFNAGAPEPCASCP